MRVRRLMGRGVASLWDWPASLFAQGEPGVWFDPSDFSTMFQDRNGTTPVTAVEQPVGRILDKSGRGFHATQATATSRPVLSARVNLLRKTEQFDDAVWTNINNQYWPNYSVISANTGLAPDGSYTADALFDTSGQTGNCQRSNGGDVGYAYSLANGLTVSCYVKNINHRYFMLIAAQENAGAGITVDLETGGITGSSGLVAGTGFVISVGNGWYRVGFTMSTASAGASHIAGIKVGLRDNSNYTFTMNRYQVYQYAQQGTGVLVWGASLVSADQAHLPYQRVNTATDYDTAGFPHYLRFDGVDDFLVTPTITPGIDKVQVFAGVRELRDAARGMVSEFGAGVLNSFGMGAPGFNLQQYDFYSQGSGTAGTASINTGFHSPRSNVLTGLGDISGDSAILRVNGTQAAISTADQGAGNYGNYPLYIGCRGGTSLPFNGHLYSLIVRFGSNLPIGTIKQSEAWVNGKTGAY